MKNMLLFWISPLNFFFILSKLENGNIWNPFEWIEAVRWVSLKEGKLVHHLRPAHMECMNIWTARTISVKVKGGKRKRNGLRIITLDSAVPFDSWLILPHPDPL